MNTAAAPRPLPAHGTLRRARGRSRLRDRRCPCRRCRRVERHYDKWRGFLNDTGRPLRVPAGPVAEHLRSLLATGVTWQGAADAARCSRSTLAALLRGQAVMRRSVAQRILAVKAAPAADHVPVDATGTVRRVRALYAAGWLQRDIAAAAGLTKQTVSLLLTDAEPRVRIGTVRAVRAAFAALEMRAAPDGPGAVRARNRAAREGWAPPLAWGEDIDDPAASPRGWVPGEVREQVAA